MDDGLEFVVTEPEAAAGFAVRTLAYEDRFELPFPAAGRARRHERCVAIVVDEANRLKRKHAGDGYVHERWDGARWTSAGEFATVDDVRGSDVYRAYQSKHRLLDEEEVPVE